MERLLAAKHVVGGVVEGLVDVGNFAPRLGGEFVDREEGRVEHVQDTLLDVEFLRLHLHPGLLSLLLDHLAVDFATRHGLELVLGPLAMEPALDDGLARFLVDLFELPEAIVVVDVPPCSESGAKHDPHYPGLPSRTIVIPRRGS